MDAHDINEELDKIAAESRRLAERIRVVRNDSRFQRVALNADYPAYLRYSHARKAYDCFCAAADALDAIPTQKE
jgi:hypothetical protein